ncbi:MAG: phosphonate metabolism protein/1,5-bisphosphokinase (PRPP-forming) PhnN [Alphaproteobacteria bacterium]|nr:MAG: phosphonate metabolism protein/1,5-bisphosphokinase (PRPP-forming) PhnN [Alphaproteobacteria bacterium]
MSYGCLSLVVGPSGAGKDTLIRGARTALAGDGTFVFPPREVTRPVAPDCEEHVSIAEAEFRARRAAGAYALSWRAHGLGYGIPRRIEHDLDRGRTVVVNVSRTVIAEARRRYPRVRVIHVTAPPALLAARLRGRGRECDLAVAARLARAEEITVTGADVVTLVNDGPPERAVQQFIHLLCQARAVV